MKKLILLSIVLISPLLRRVVGATDASGEAFAQSVTIKPGTFQYASIIGSQFNFNGDSSFTGSGAAFFNAGQGGTLDARVSIPLPNGAKIVGMTALFVDNSASQNLKFRLLYVNTAGGSGAIEDMDITPPTSSMIQSATIAVSPAYTINASNTILYIEAQLSNTAVTWPGSTLSINGVIVKYVLE